MPIIIVEGIEKEVLVEEYLRHLLGDLLDRFDPEELRVTESGREEQSKDE